MTSQIKSKSKQMEDGSRTSESHKTQKHKCAAGYVMWWFHSYDVRGKKYH